jgi:hypothetical protein
MTFGEQMVELSFNPSGDDTAVQCKAMFAKQIDGMDALRKRRGASFEQNNIAHEAILKMMDAQMWAVKALTWKD